MTTDDDPFSLYEANEDLTGPRRHRADILRNGADRPRALRPSPLASSVKHDSPHSDHPHKQREADERSRFVRDCAQDGVSHAGPEKIVVIGNPELTGWMSMRFAKAAAQPAAAGQASIDDHDGGPPEPWPSSPQHVKEV